MKISREWLQTFFTAPLPDVHELSHALTFHAFEIESVENDVLDVKVTPNRGHDCLCYRGIAKEVSAILNIPYVENKHSIDKSVLEKKTETVSVEIREPSLCNRYIAGHIKGVKVGPSPDWLVKHLERMGQQSINNVVDATNFVMFNVGQPLHAFDAGKLASSSELLASRKYKIEIRKARKGEKMITLDKKEQELSETMLVIADGNADKPVGIAGVKGGMASGIDDSTTDIIIESANFDGVSVRRTAQALKLRTDASVRFEQVISPEMARFGMWATVDLITQLAGGEIVGFVDEYPNKQERTSVSVSLAHANRLLGTSLSSGDVEDVFSRLNFHFEKKGEVFTVTAPVERIDILIPEDLIEEVGRIVGYDKVEARELSPLSRKTAENGFLRHVEQIREELLSQGYSEVYSSVFSDTGERAVSNKVGGEKPFLRSNLADGLQDALKRNILNKDLLGLSEVKLFEIGSVWKKDKEEIHVATASEKSGASEKTLDEYGSGQAEDTFPASGAERYVPFSRYPYIVRDVALWVPKSTLPADVLDIIRHHSGELLVRSELFDTFEKGEKVSYAFRLVFQSFDKTLTDDDANHRMESVYGALKTKGYEIR
ncbi:phenylalanine--tRNA ligase subunit beta [Candidatus Kaiserbacteria bacterium]|nr:phenylalanine--tRNA ligase subunit beta [Candidatus Kaiserbacteria bacterium]